MKILSLAILVSVLKITSAFADETTAMINAFSLGQPVIICADPGVINTSISQVVGAKNFKQVGSSSMAASDSDRGARMAFVCVTISKI